MKTSKTSKHSTATESAVVPRAPKKPSQFENHGDLRVDDYFWLRNREDADTMAYLNAENDHYQKNLAPLKKFSDKLFKEMKARIKEDDSSVPANWASFTYYSRYKKGLQYPIECRKALSKTGKPQGPEQIILDQNELAKGKKYFHTAGSVISPNQNFLAYSTDFDGSEKYEIKIKSLSDGKIFEDGIENSNGSCAWANDNQTLFYVVLDSNLRPFQVKRHKVGSDAKQDVVVFEEKDPMFFVGVERSASGKFILIETSGKVSSEYSYLSADTPDLAFQLFEARKDNLEYYIDHGSDGFYIRTNLKAENFRLMTCPEGKTAKKYWKDLIPHNPKVLLQSFACFKNFLYIGQRANGLPQALIVQLKPFKKHQIKFKDEAYNVGQMSGHEFDTELVRFSYSSPVQPPSVFDYNMRTKKQILRKVTEVKGFKASNYKCKRVWAKSHDGTKVPLVLLMKKNFKTNSKSAAYLYGYGSYGMIIPDGFKRDILSLVDRGFVVAIAHIRGGQEMGRHWYEDGKFLKKKNTFHDFIACAEYLQKNKYCTPSTLCIAGGSAGGMLVGACMNMRPELFGLVVAHVPFVDVINTMFDVDLPLTQTEFKEWGNPTDKKYYRYMKSYSPYDNVAAKKYPALFVTAGLNDPRVTYWEPAKWVAKLRELKKDDNQIVFKINMGAGHFGASGRFEYLKETAEEYAYICKMMNIKK